MGNLFIYQSSAGSGKTYTLAKEYVKLALTSPGYFKHILAITFTNKATQEMQSRIIKFLKELSEDSNPELLKQISAETGRKNIPDDAKKTLESILHNYSEFSVSTIDSFFNKILRSFAKELNLSAGFEIELKSGNVLPEIVSELWKDSMSDEELRTYLEKYIKEKMDKDEGWDIDGSILKLANEIFRERYYEKKINRGDSFDIEKNKVRNFVDTVNNIIKEYKEGFIEISKKAEEQIKKYDLNPEEFKWGDKGGIYWLAVKIQMGNFDPKIRGRAPLEDEKEWYTKTNPRRNEIIECYNNGLLDILNEAVNYYDSNTMKIKTAELVLKTIYVLGIFADILKVLSRYRDKNNILFQQDVSIILRKLLDKENVPFIYEKTGNKYYHFLIDEFQDTSNFQWNNLLPLVDNGLSEQNTSVIVGDDKQAIYRWREGNPDLLISGVEKALGHYKTMIKKIPLNENYRSNDNIIEFNNKVFDNSFSTSAFQKPNESKPGGYIKISFHQTQKNETADTTRQAGREKTLQFIHSLIEKKFELKDILILVRKRSEGTDIANYLSANNIEIVSSESLLVCASPKVNFIVSILKYLCNRKNQIAKKEILINYLEYLKLGENEKEIFAKLSKGLSGLTVYELIEELIRRFDLQNLFDPYLAKLLEAAFKFSTDKNSNVLSFLEWWKINSDEERISIPEDINAVKILTIHKAKGLQSPVVILPFVDWRMDIEPNKGYYWVSTNEKPFDEFTDYLVKLNNESENTYFEDDLKIENDKTRRDNLNLLYVALTRPEKILFVNAVLPTEESVKDTVGMFLYKKIFDNPELNKDLKEKEFMVGELDDNSFFILSPPRRTKNLSTVEKNDKNKASQTPMQYISSEWYKKTVVKTSNHLIKPWDPGFDKISFGETIHEVLSQIKYAEDIESVLQNSVRNGLISSEKALILKDVFEKLLKDEKRKDWYSAEWKVYNETDIILPGGELLRPDRVITKENESIIIDYKTGRENHLYEKQLIRYADALLNMGLKNIKKFLLYIPSDSETEFKVKEVK